MNKSYVINAFFISFFIVLITSAPQAQNLTGEEVLDKSIQYHDSEGLFTKGDYTLHFVEARPDGSKQKASARLSPAKETFEITRMRKGREVRYVIDPLETNIYLDGHSDYSTEEVSEFNLNIERAQLLKNYYLYLWHLPMKLKDPGTIVHEETRWAEFYKYDAIEVKVTYDENVGSDTWYFYFRPDNFKLVGYRFYHDESQNDGEYIILEDEITENGIRIPSVRRWYTHKEDKYLGTDTLVKIMNNEQ